MYPIYNNAQSIQIVQYVTFFVGLIADQLVPNLHMYMLHAFQIRNIFQNSSKEETKFYEKILVLYITQILLADEICSIELRNQI